jgi:hypothetical protein
MIFDGRFICEGAEDSSEEFAYKPAFLIPTVELSDWFQGQSDLHNA